MNEIEIQLPKLGESIVSATVVQWLKKEGDLVSQDEPLLEVSTDKINSEIPAPKAGILSKILVRETQEVDVGAVLATLQVTDASAPVKVLEKPVGSASVEEQENFISPAVLHMAGEHKVSLETLLKLKGTGRGNRLTKTDLEEYVNRKPVVTAPVITDAVQKVPMCGLRKAIAANLVKSFYEAPHASLVAEVDVTSLMSFIQKNKESFLQTYGVKLTVTSYLIKAITEAIAHYPMVNASVDKETILIKKFVNLGIAVSVENGVVVPVIQNCQSKDIPTIAGEIAVLAGKARTGKLNQVDVDGGTITMTNFGMSGMLMGTPIIRFPEVAIIGLGSIHKKVDVLENDTFGIRQKVYVTLTFDHRVIDGIYGADFLNHVRSGLEKTNFSIEQPSVRS